jgi:hypothetical protein
VIRQVRESEPDISTTHSSPTMQAVNNLAETLEGIPEDHTMSLDSAPVGGFTGKGLFGTFARQSSSANGGKDFWNAFGDQHRTPPPPTLILRGSLSTTMSDDVNMDFPAVTTPSSSIFPPNWAVPTMEQSSTQPESSRASTPQAQILPTTNGGPSHPLSAADGLRKVNKRRRDDDLDMQSIKRRAVSPGVSVGNSPILSQSPSQRSDNLWGQTNKPPPSTAREGSVSSHNHGERAGSNGSISQTPLLGPKRVGLQGMNDMQGMAEKMSIE